MKSKINSLIILSLIISIVFINTGINFATTDEIKKTKRELEEVNGSLEENAEDIEENITFQNQTAYNMRQTEVDIANLESEILVLEDEISMAETNIMIKEEEMKITEIHIGNKNESLESRLRVMYKTGEVGYMEVLMGAEDFLDLLTRMDMIQYIINQDQELIRELKELESLIESQTLSLDSQKASLEGVKSEKETSQANLNQKWSQLYAYKIELENDQVAMKEIEENLLTDANSLTEKIENLELQAQYVGGELSWPLENDYDISSYFGMRTHPVYGDQRLHTGIDIPTDLNSNVMAANDGIVIFANWYGGYGRLVMIDHGGGIVTLYGHNNGIAVTVGQKVNRGDVIAYAGTTGDSTGVHCHFEVRLDGEYVDPFIYLKE